MHVLALGDGLHDAPDIDAVLDERVALAIVAKRELMADRDVVLRDDLDVLVLFHDPAIDVLAGLDPFDDDDADAVAFLVHDEMNHALILFACPTAAASCSRSPRSAWLQWRRCARS